MRTAQCNALHFACINELTLEIYSVSTLQMITKSLCFMNEFELSNDLCTKVCVDKYFSFQIIFFFLKKKIFFNATHTHT